MKSTSTHEKKKNYSVHSDELAVPEIRLNVEKSEVEGEEPDFPEINYDTALPEIHIRRNREKSSH